MSSKVYVSSSAARLRVCLAALAACGLASVMGGCPAHEQTFPAVPPPTHGGEPMVAGTSVPRDGRGRYFIIVRLRIITIEVPVGTASMSEEVWSYLDEESIEAGRAGTLGRNGFRIGRGHKNTLPDVAKILKRMTGKKLGETMLMAMPGSPVPFVLKRQPDARTVFTFHDDRTLSGADYPPGEYLLTMVCTLDEDDPSVVLITGVPQVRSRYHRPEAARKMGKMSITASPVLYTFRPLVYQVRAPSGDFIVIGPGVESRRANSPGHEFLVRDKAGMEFETLLVLVPEVFASPVRQGPAITVPEGASGQ